MVICPHPNFKAEPISFIVMHNFSAFITDNTIHNDILRGNYNTAVILSFLDYSAYEHVTYKNRDYNGVQQLPCSISCQKQ
jgi:hypothetical protein